MRSCPGLSFLAPILAVVALGGAGVAGYRYYTGECPLSGMAGTSATLVSTSPAQEKSQSCCAGGVAEAEATVVLASTADASCAAEATCHGKAADACPGAAGACSGDATAVVTTVAATTDADPCCKDKGEACCKKTGGAPCPEGGCCSGEKPAEAPPATGGKQ